MPPFSGFLSKLVLMRAGLGGGTGSIVAVAVADQLPHAALDDEDLVLRVLGHAARAPPAATGWRGRRRRRRCWSRSPSCSAFGAQPFLRLADDAADDVVDARAPTCDAVLGAAPAVAGATERGHERAPVLLFLRYLRDPRRARSVLGEHRRGQARARPDRPPALGLRRGADGRRRPTSRSRCLANSITLTPGTITVHVEPAQRTHRDPRDRHRRRSGGRAASTKTRARSEHPAVDARRPARRSAMSPLLAATTDVCLLAALRRRPRCASTA